MNEPISLISNLRDTRMDNLKKFYNAAIRWGFAILGTLVLLSAFVNGRVLELMILGGLLYFFIATLWHKFEADIQAVRRYFSI